MKCDCGNPAKILTGDKPLCWTCHRRKCGKEEWIIELMRPEDERGKRGNSDSMLNLIRKGRKRQGNEGRIYT